MGKMTNNSILIVLTVLSLVLWIAQPVSSETAMNGKAMETDTSEYELTNEQIAELLSDDGISLIPQFDEQSASTYTLGVDDVVEVSVMRHPEVSGNYAINKEGKIQYGFVGDVELAGLTKSESAEYITEILEKYIINPEVNVIITGYFSKVVYVIGEVGNPGKIIMRGDTITVRDALIQAGLPLLTAKVTKGTVITPAADGNAEQKRVNVHKLLYKGDLRENLVMKPGDTLYVPPTMMAKAMRVIQPVASPVAATAGTVGVVSN